MICNRKFSFNLGAYFWPLPQSHDRKKNKVGAQFLHHVKPMDERALPKFETPLGPALGSLISKTPLGSFLRVP